MFSASKTSGPSGYNLTNSLRFRASASAFLNRTFGSTYTDKTKSTLSFWVKRGLLNVTNGQTIMWYNASGASGHITFAGAGAGGTLVNDCLNFSNRNATTGSGDYGFQTTQLFRDTAAWYHIMVVFDTGQATSSNRVKLYVNGSEVTSFVSAQYPPQNYQTTAFLGGNASAHIIGYGATTGATVYFDGYLDEYHFIDGQALTPSSFGSFNATTGVWQPARYTGTYGTNGFYLNFTDIGLTSGSNAGLGRDFSGNGNFWNTNNISVTAGTTYDAMLDVPTLTSATAGNYCTLNSAIRILSGSITEGNLRGAGSDFECWGTIAFPSTGKFYFEYTQNGSTGAGAGPGTGIQGINPPDVDYGVHYHRDGRKWVNGTYSSYGATFTTNDIIGVAYDADSNSITFYKNNVSQGAISTTSGYTYLPYQFDNSGNGGFLNFGQRPFAYTPPTGFNRLNTFNLPNSTIVKGNTVMDATIYTGNGANRSITNAAGFRPDLVWGQARSAAYGSWLFDSVRGATRQISSFSTNAESIQSTMLTAFNSNGFNMGTDTAGNQSSITYVAWQWQAGQGSTSSNTSGSITSTVSVNATAGFSIVTYTSQASGVATVGHGLGVAPAMIILKQRASAGTWTVYHQSLGNNAYLILNTTAAQVTGASTVWNTTSPTSTVYTLGSAWGGTGTMVAYCWAEIAGFSRFGSYTGNSSSDGPFVYLGFRPEFVMVKRSSSTGPWEMLDATRNTFNITQNGLRANAADAEQTGIGPFDFLSNGFKLRGIGGVTNDAGTFIYAAFAENPFKNALAR